MISLQTRKRPLSRCGRSTCSFSDYFRRRAVFSTVFFVAFLTAFFAGVFLAAAFLRAFFAVDFLPAVLVPGFLTFGTGPFCAICSTGAFVEGAFFKLQSPSSPLHRLPS